MANGNKPTLGFSNFMQKHAPETYESMRPAPSQNIPTVPVDAQGVPFGVPKNPDGSADYLGMSNYDRIKATTSPAWQSTTAGLGAIFGAIDADKRNAINAPLPQFNYNDPLAAAGLRAVDTGTGIKIMQGLRPGDTMIRPGGGMPEGFRQNVAGVYTNRPEGMAMGDVGGPALPSAPGNYTNQLLQELGRAPGGGNPNQVSFNMPQGQELSGLSGMWQNPMAYGGPGPDQIGHSPVAGPYTDRPVGYGGPPGMQNVNAQPSFWQGLRQNLTGYASPGDPNYGRNLSPMGVPDVNPVTAAVGGMSQTHQSGQGLQMPEPTGPAAAAGNEAAKKVLSMSGIPDELKQTLFQNLSNTLGMGPHEMGAQRYNLSMGNIMDMIRANPDLASGSVTGHSSGKTATYRRPLIDVVSALGDVASAMFQQGDTAGAHAATTLANMMVGDTEAEANLFGKGMAEAGKGEKAEDKVTLEAMKAAFAQDPNLAMNYLNYGTINPPAEPGVSATGKAPGKQGTGKAKLTKGDVRSQAIDMQQPAVGGQGRSWNDQLMNAFNTGYGD